jgi:hypothetical protein
MRDPSQAGIVRRGTKSLGERYLTPFAEAIHQFG